MRLIPNLRCPDCTREALTTDGQYVWCTAVITHIVSVAFDGTETVERDACQFRQAIHSPHDPPA